MHADSMPISNAMPRYPEAEIVFVMNWKRRARICSVIQFLSINVRFRTIPRNGLGRIVKMQSWGAKPSYASNSQADFCAPNTTETAVPSRLIGSMTVRELLLVSTFSLFPAMGIAQGTHLWTQPRFDDLEKGRPQQVAIFNDGRLAVGPELKEALTTPSTYVWSLAAGANGTAFLGTGTPATLLRASADGHLTPLFETKDLSVQVVRASKDGWVYAATLPSGKVYRFRADALDKKTDENAELVFDPSMTEEKPKYIWDMAFDAQGKLYLATGAPAAIYRIDTAQPKAKPELFFKSDEQHIRTMAFDAQGNLIAGAEGSGLVYRIDKKGSGFVLFDAPKREITALAIDKDGTVYVANVGDKTRNPLPPLPVQGVAMATVTILQPGSIQNFSSSGILADGTDVYMLKADAAPKKLWSSREDIVYCLRPTADGLLALTGNRGRIYRITPDGEFSDLGHLDASQGVAMADDANGYLIGTANTGKLYRMSSKPAPEGTYISDTLDGQVFSRWGRAEVDLGSQQSTYQLFTRTGNVDNPNRGWSDWKPVENGQITSPAARFLQWKAVLHTGATLGTIGINYLPVNAPPMVDEVVVVPGARVNTQAAAAIAQPSTITISLQQTERNTISFPVDPSNQPLTAAKDKAAITARWSTHDDNGDDLSYDLYYRGDKEQTWELLKKQITDRFYSFDAAQLPDGGYRLKVVASDSPSHTPGEELQAEKVSDRFVVDTTPPVLSELSARLENGKIHATLTAADATSPIAHAEYSIDAGPWQYLEPVGKLSDNLQEHYDFSASLPQKQQNEAPRSEHLLTVRVYDRHENMSAAKAAVK